MSNPSTPAEIAAARQAELRESLRRMSDQAIRYQLENGAFGGAQRAAVWAEAVRRGIR